MWGVGVQVVWTAGARSGRRLSGGMGSPSPFGFPIYIPEHGTTLPHRARSYFPGWGAGAAEADVGSGLAAAALERAHGDRPTFLPVVDLV